MKQANEALRTLRGLYIHRTGNTVYFDTKTLAAVRSVRVALVSPVCTLEEPAQAGSRCTGGVLFGSLDDESVPGQAPPACRVWVAHRQGTGNALYRSPYAHNLETPSRHIMSSGTISQGEASSTMKLPRVRRILRTLVSW